MTSKVILCIDFFQKTIENTKANNEEVGKYNYMIHNQASKTMPARGQSTEVVGEKHGRLTVMIKTGRTKDRKTLVMCKCDCGNTAVVILKNLRNGNTRSCGCLSNERRAKTSREHAKHGMHDSAEYHTWEGMIQRCTNPNTIGWPNYGGRGISVCERWLDFKNFYSDMGQKPKGYTIERIDNNGPYSPENCRWATTREQSLNQRRSTYFTIGGVTAHISEWGAKIGITPNLIRARLRNGWSEKAALTTPHIRKSKNRVHRDSTPRDSRQ